MYVEAFSEGKNLDAPDENEDQFIVVPDRFYGVIDGVTSRTGRRYQGMLAGRLAGLVVRRAVAEHLLDDGGLCRCHAPDLIDHVNRALRAAYHQFGMLEQAKADTGVRFGATLALMCDLGSTFRFILVGDSGVRIKPHEFVRDDNALDLITASLRQNIYRRLQGAGATTSDCEKASRACAFHGTTAVHDDMLPWITGQTLESVFDECYESCAARFPEVPRKEIIKLLRGGVVDGQGEFQNSAEYKLGYACFDGFDIPPGLISVFDRPKAAADTVELFTDGYFAIPQGRTVADWEAAFDEIERSDPAKIDRHPSVKGTVGRIRADDRTIVIVRHGGR